MDPRHQELAAEFCEMVQSTDLLAYLKVGPDASPSEALGALKAERRRLQAMQANPKFKDIARFFIKHYRTFESLLEEPAAHVEASRRAAEDDKLPLLEVAIDGVLVDGVLTEEEVAFVRESAASLGISRDRADDALRRRAAQRDIPFPAVSNAPLPVPSAGLRGLKTVEPATRRRAAPPASAGPAQQAAWWDERLTRILLDVVPAGTRRVVDIACGYAWSAHHLLPHRPDMEYLGIDRVDVRVAQTQRSLSTAAFRDRAVILVGSPDTLPLADDSVDVVLSLMAMRKFERTGGALREAWRVLRPGGRVVVLEPDSHGQQFYWNGNLVRFNDVFRDLVSAGDERVGSDVADPIERPGLSLGPVLAPRLQAAHFQPRPPVIHPIQLARYETMPRFAGRLRAYVAQMARLGGLSPDEAPVAAAESEIEALVTAADDTTEGMGVHVWPAFVCVGVKPG